jgi:hypothetical protein
MCDNAHIQAGKGGIDLRESKKIEAVLQFRNPRYNEKEIDALKCEPRVPGSRTPSPENHRGGSSSSSSSSRRSFTNDAMGPMMHQRRPSINPNARRMDAGLVTTDVASSSTKNKRGKTAESQSGRYPEKITDLDELVDVELGYEQQSSGVNSKKRSNFTIGSNSMNRRGRNPDGTLKQQRNADVDQRYRLQSLNEKVADDDGASTSSPNTDDRRSEISQLCDKLDKKVDVDSNTRRNDRDSVGSGNPQQRGNPDEGHSTPTSEAVGFSLTQQSCVTSNVFTPDVVLGAETDVFYLTKGLREDCVFYLEGSELSSDEGTLFYFVRIIHHVCGLIIPP